MFLSAEVGDKVWSIQCGDCVIHNFEIGDEFPVVTKDTNGTLYGYTEHGRYFHEDVAPSLFWKKPVFDIPSKPKEKVDPARMKFIFINTSFEGFHSYPDAPNEVEFLRVNHRHIFHVKVAIEVFHNERDIEFILFKRFIESLIKTNDFNSKSCEMISDELYKDVAEAYPNRNIEITVSEDGENGSEIYYKKGN